MVPEKCGTSVRCAVPGPVPPSRVAGRAGCAAGGEGRRRPRGRARRARSQERPRRGGALVSRSDTERLRDILECIEGIDRAEATVRRYPGDPDVATVAMDAVQRRVFT